MKLILNVQKEGERVCASNPGANPVDERVSDWRLWEFTGMPPHLQGTPRLAPPATNRDLRVEGRQASARWMFST